VHACRPALGSIERRLLGSGGWSQNKAMEQYPLEGNLTVLVTRATLKEYGLLVSEKKEKEKKKK
jgi:hypothetical protein